MQFFRLISCYGLLAYTHLLWASVPVDDPQAFLDHIESILVVDPRQSEQLLSDAMLNEAIQRSDDLQSHLYNLTAQVALLNGQLEKAAIDIQTAQRLARKANNQFQLAEAKRREGILLMLLNQYADSLGLMNQSLVIHRQLNSSKIPAILESIGNIYLLMEQYEKLKQNSYALLAEATQRQQPRRIFSAHYFLTEVFLAEDNLDVAYQHIRALFELQNENPNTIQALAYTSLAKFDAAKGNVDNAIKHIDIARQLAESYQFTIGLPEIMLAKAKILKQFGDYEQASMSLLDAVNMANQLNMRSIQLKALESLSNIAEAQGDFKSALLYLQQYTQLKLKTNLDIERKLLAVNQSRLDISEKDNQIATLQLQQQLSNQERKFHFGITLILIFSTLLLTSFLVMLYRQKRKLGVTLRELENASSAKTQFLTRMSHEIRTPLNAIIGLTNMSLKAPEAATTLENLKQVEESSQTLLKIIDDILDYSKVEANQMHISAINFGIDDVINRSLRAISVAASEKHVSLNVEYAIDVPKQAIGDPLRLQQVLNNLLSNAIKFTDKGNINVRVIRRYQKQPLTLEFQVQDTGIGISPDVAGSLFNAFTQADESITREYGGSGLGLAITKQLVELMGGSIWIKSEPNQGSCFYFTVELRSSARVSPLRLHPEHLSALTVLIVDDTTVSAQRLANALTTLGIKSDRVGTAIAGRDKFMEALRKRAPYDVIFMDGHLPDVEGVNLTRIIRQFGRNHQPIIVLLSSVDVSAFNSSADLSDVNYVLPSSADTEMLQGVLSEVSHEHEPIYQNQYLSGTVPDFSQLRVLLVDDSPINIKVTLAYLAETRAQVVTAENGQQAVELYSSDRAFDVVLMDIQMPVMDGFSATKIIREALGSSIPIIGVTAHVLQSEVQRCLDIGMNAHLAKPIKSNELYALIAKVTKTSLSMHSTEALSKRRDAKLAVLPSSLLEVEYQRAMQTLGISAIEYVDFAEEFIQMYQSNPILSPVVTTHSLIVAKECVHRFRPALSYIGAYHLAQLASTLTQSLAHGTVPLPESTQQQLILFTTSLEKVTQRLQEIISQDIDATIQRRAD